MMLQLHNVHLEPIVDRALREDWGNGDWTTDLSIAPGVFGVGELRAVEDLTVAGVEVAASVFERVDPSLKIEMIATNGSSCHKGAPILRVSGAARSIVKAERVALNFLSRMSGVASVTRQYVDALAGFSTQLLDSRTTTPGLRLIEKAATAAGGARNHRLCLAEGVLVQEHHIKMAGSITKVVNRLSESLPPTLKIEVNARTLDDVHEALEAGADLILLDNMSLSKISLAVRTVRNRVRLEASGTIPLAQIRGVAETGVDFISTGAILQDAPWARIGLTIL